MTGLYGGQNGTPHGTIVVGAIGGYGEWHQNGGQTTCTQRVIVGEYDYWGNYTTGEGYLDLAGGTFTAPQIIAHTAAGMRTVLSTVNFQGGTLQASANSSDFITNVGGGDAVKWTR